MKVLPKLLVALTASLLLSSCAATGPKFTELESSILTLPPETGRIYIYRTSVLGAAIQPTVRLNGEEVGQAVPYGFFYVDRKPGAYEIVTSTEVDRKLSLTLDKGQIRYVRLSVSIGFFVGHVYPELVENQVGQKEIQDCRYIGQQYGNGRQTRHSDNARAERKD